MNLMHKNRMQPKAVLLAVFFAAGSTLAVATAAASTGLPLQATDAPAAGGTRVAGTVMSISGNVVVVKDDKGTESKVTVPDTARVLQLPAGAKSLSAATPIKVQDIAVGDRVLAKITAEGSGFTASTLLAMKQADVAQKQQKDRQDWQTRGINGLVKSVDPAGQTVTVSTGSGPSAKTVTVQATKSSAIRRYAPDSTKFDDAKPATLDQIKVGDQLRAKGEKSADGSQINAEEIVAGTFHNIAGTVISVDPAANTVTVNDLATKKPFTVSINADSQLHKLPPMMAQGMAMRLKGGSGAPGAGGPPSMGAPLSGAKTPPAAGGNPAAGNGRQMSAEPAGGGSEASGQRGGDLQQALNRAPVLQLADLKKGDAVMVLTTEGQNPGAATAITLLAGVEPLLQASPNASQSVLSASWNLGGGGAGGQDAQ